MMAKSEYTLEMSTQQFMAARRTAGGEQEGKTSDDQAGAAHVNDWTADPHVDPVALEHDKPVSYYEYLVGLEFYDEEDDARFRVTKLSEEMLAITLTDAGSAEVSRCYVLAHYFDLESGKEYYTTAKEVAAWVDETQAATAKRLARDAAAAVRTRAEYGQVQKSTKARGGNRPLRAQRRVQYTK